MDILDVKTSPRDLKLFLNIKIHIIFTYYILNDLINIDTLN